MVFIDPLIEQLLIEQMEKLRLALKQKGPM